MLKQELKLALNIPLENLKHIGPLSQVQERGVEAELVGPEVMQTTIEPFHLYNKPDMHMDKAWTVKPQ